MGYAVGARAVAGAAWVGDLRFRGVRVMAYLTTSVCASDLAEALSGDMETLAETLHFLSGRLYQSDLDDLDVYMPYGVHLVEEERAGFRALAALLVKAADSA